MDPPVGRATLPLHEVIVLSAKARKLPALEGVLLHVVDATLDLALVPRCSRLRGEYDGAVVAAEVLELRVEFGIEPVGFQYPGLEVVDDERAGHAAEVFERVLQAPNEVIGRLREDGLAVASTRV